ncbi:MAG TPA: hypothetical protein PLN52_26090 [Opitutaceae bacterium]|nr:hypothetical protein [Opitutaceae bacterium]HRE84540.1 hypothetical protein [Opitutaceae bacterium]
MKVYLDDVRSAPDGWHRVYWPDEAVALLKRGAVTEISLDHDLGDDSRGTGYDVIAWIEEAVVTQGFQPPAIIIHSANPVGRERMQRGIAAIKRAKENQA